VGVLTTLSAARLLAATTSLEALAALGNALGFGAPLPIDRSTARQLGVPRTARAARVAGGRGALRLLLCEFDADARTHTTTLARTIVRNAPHHSWLLLTRDAGSGALFVAAPPPSGIGAVPALEVDPARVRESDAETLSTMVGATGGSDLLVHHRWRETLGRDALTRRFYRELEAQVGTMAESAVGRAPAEARRTIALLHASRLLFLAFLEARGWLDGDREFLRTQFVARSGGRGAHHRLLEPLWFGTLNTPLRARAATARSFGRVPFLNGGLFTRSPIETRYRDLRLTDDAIGGMIGGLLSRYRLTARETSDAWSDAAVDPEMLGRAFESLMHEGTRRAQGAFYTPPALITRLGRDGIAAALAPRGVSSALLEAIWSGEVVGASDRTTLHQALCGGRDAESRTAPLRILDPACGSGAFLVFALEELAQLRAAAGDPRDVAARRRDVLTQSIFGVDLDPTAVWLCQLRLWLSVVVDEPHEDPTRVAPLPNLDRNVREGDALAGIGFADARPETDPHLATRRLRYARASGVRKRTLGAALAREERGRALRMLTAELDSLTAQRRDLIAAARSPDLFTRTRGADRATRAALDALRAQVRRLRARIEGLRNGAALPFSFATHFAEVASSGGFDLVIGNPPWVRTHVIPADQRAALRDRFTVFKSAAWESGAASAAVGKGFAGQADLAALFTERAVTLAAPAGAIALLLPAKLWGSLAGGGVRRLLTRQAPPMILEDWSGSSAGFDAVVYPSALVARRGGVAPPDILTTVHREDRPLTWLTQRARLALDDSPGAPWLLLPTEVREAFDSLERAGVPLAESALGRPLLGVKSGCNDAFVLSRGEAEAARIEAQCLRPLLRGEHLQPWQATAHATESAILWTHDARGEPLASLPTATHRRLLPWRRQLEQRTDGRGGRWWALFRTEAARSDQPRVVWGDIGRAPRALVLRAGDPTVPLNTCYVVRTRSEDSAYAFAVLLNSPVGAAWLGALAEPARGGYRRFLGWTCARFPVPRDWERACALLAPLGRAASAGQVTDAWTLTERVLEAYGRSHGELAPLLSWHGL
jgi:hypothetical protein